VTAVAAPRRFARRGYRELRLRTTVPRLERGLRAAARTRRPVAVGPFLGEVGFEVLYWLPMVRWLLADHGVDRERVTALTRGGAGAWYEDVAARTIDFYDLVDPGAAPARLAERRARAGDQKQLTIDPLDRELIRAAGLHDAHLLHPIVMFAALRYALAGRAPLDAVGERARYRPIDAGPPPPELPATYVALRVYFSDSLPDTPAVRDRLEALTAALAEHEEVVVVADDLAYDGHTSWRPRSDSPRVHVTGCGAPAENLDRQARIVAGARSFVTTYGGLAQLAPFLGVPCVGLLGAPLANERHYAVCRRAARALGAPAPRLLAIEDAAAVMLAVRS
jgi:hypothetical protein